MYNITYFILLGIICLVAMYLVDIKLPFRPFFRHACIYHECIKRLAHRLFFMRIF